MIILIDARLYGLEHAGLGRYTINLLKELSKVDKTNQYIVLLRKKYFVELAFPKNWKKVLADFRHYTFAEQIAIPGIIKAQKPDIVHFLHFNIPLFYSGKFVVTIHDVLMHKQKGLEATTLPFYSYWLKRLGYGLVFKTAVTEAEKIIVPSNTVKKEVIDHYKIKPEKVFVIYDGINSEFFTEPGSKNLPKKYGLTSPYFIYAGNAYPHKNLEKGIEATIFLNKGWKEKILFAIASSRDFFAKKLERKVDAMKAKKYVKILGFVRDEDLSSLYKNSQAFLTPSLMEGFGLPGLEAMAGGTLTLASNIPVFKEVYKDAAIYFDPQSVDSIVEAMQKTITMNNERRTKLVNYGKKFAKRYSWQKMAKETLRIYENVGVKET